MPTGMGVASPKFSKSNRKPKKTKHCTVPNPRKTKGLKKTPRRRDKQALKIEITNDVGIF